MTSLIGSPVIAQHVPKPIGYVRDAVIDPEHGKVVCWELRSRRANRFLATIDVLGYTDNGLLIGDADVPQSLNDLARVKILLEHPVHLLKLPVVTEQQKRLGRVKDCLIETTGHFIAKLFVAPSLLTRVFEDEIVIGRERVIKITAAKVIVRYDVKSPARAGEPEII